MASHWWYLPLLLVIYTISWDRSTPAEIGPLPPEPVVILDEPFKRPPALFTCPKGSLGCHAQGANASEAGSWVRPQHCCCQPPRRCWNGKACVVCPGSLTAWRAAVGLQADLLLLGVLSCPRLASLWLLAEDALDMPTAPDPGALSRWWLDRLSTADGQVAESVDGLFGSPVSGAVTWLLCPQWHLVVPLLPSASDSFWWVLALVHASLMHWLTDLALLVSLFFCSERIVLELQSYALSAGIAVMEATTVYVAYALSPSLGAAVADAFIRILCLWHALDACSKPLRALWVMRDHFLAANVFATIHLLLLTALISVSNGGHMSYDAMTLMLLVGPGSLAVLRFRDGFLLERAQSCIVVDRRRLLESTVEALSRLGPRALQSGLPHVTFVSGASAQSVEEGVDAGGVVRDWLNQVTAEAFNPARGLVDVAVLDGTPYARLRPGGDLSQLEAAGKVMGLALRVGQPLGVDVCAPLAHLLAHPSLPQALEAIAASHRSCSSAEEEPLAADFSSDGPPPLPKLSGWERLRHHRERRRHFLAVTELLRMGFSRDWLRWVSSEEYDYWRRCLLGDQPVGERARNVRALGVEAADGSAVTLRNVREHMARRALDALVLDVRKETEALWRGLHSIPGVPLPQLRSEVRGSKRLRSHAAEEEEEELQPGGLRAPKRRKLAAVGPSEAPQASSNLTEAPHKRKHDGEQAILASRAGADAEGDTQEPLAKRPRHQLDAEHLEPSPLQMLLSGNRDVPVEDWKRFTTCDFGSEIVIVQDSSASGPSIVRQPSQRARQTLEWFWAYVEQLPAKERADLLEWITGYRRLPAGGFPPPVRLMTISLVDSDQHLPVAHTCSLQLDLPAGYGSAETLRAKLAEAAAQRSFLIA